jgi:hypothetical protein
MPRSIKILKFGFIGNVGVAPDDNIIEGVPDDLAWQAVKIGLAMYVDEDKFLNGE